MKVKQLPEHWTYPLFVFGTLRKGMGNHHLISGFNENKFLGYAILPNHGVRGLNVIPNENYFVIGEVYEIFDDVSKQYIDSLEGYPHGYQTKVEKVFLLVEEGHFTDQQIYEMYLDFLEGKNDKFVEIKAFHYFYTYRNMYDNEKYKYDLTYSVRWR